MKQQFIDLLLKTERPGINNLIAYLDTQTDFFTAPASRKYHGAKEGGLLEHSIAVNKNIDLVCSSIGLVTQWDSRRIVALLHDVCKANFYRKGIRNIKNQQTGQWEPIEVYEFDDQLPLGHGEKSVMILQRYIYLLDEEMMAIRWHMGGFDDTARSYAGGLQLSAAMQKYPLITVLHTADLIASNIQKT